MKKLVFYRCNICGNIVIKLVDKGTPISCCGQPMEIITPNTTEGAIEKHMPVSKVENGVITVQVGSTLHPMTSEHYITQIIIETTKGFKIFELTPENQPIVSITLSQDEDYVNSYAICNLHGLWAEK